LTRCLKAERRPKAPIFFLENEVKKVSERADGVQGGFLPTVWRCGAAGLGVQEVF
jgi:hypothetical protein